MGSVKFSSSLYHVKLFVPKIYFTIDIIYMVYNRMLKNLFWMVDLLIYLLVDSSLHWGFFVGS
jgi:hypothetical protein